MQLKWIKIKLKLIFELLQILLEILKLNFKYLKWELKNIKMKFGTEVKDENGKIKTIYITFIKKILKICIVIAALYFGKKEMRSREPKK